MNLLLRVEWIILIAVAWIAHVYWDFPIAVCWTACILWIGISLIITLLLYWSAESPPQSMHKENKNPYSKTTREIFTQEKKHKNG